MPKLQSTAQAGDGTCHAAAWNGLWIMIASCIVIWRIVWHRPRTYVWLLFFFFFLHMTWQPFLHPAVAPGRQQRRYTLWENLKDCSKVLWNQKIPWFDLCFDCPFWLYQLTNYQVFLNKLWDSLTTCNSAAAQALKDNQQRVKWPLICPSHGNTFQ